MIYNLYKKRSETPLECIQRFVEKNPKLGEEKMTYLGRLDPLAEGVLLVASGKDTSQKRREEFLKMEKEYIFKALFGFSTDSYDILGKITSKKKVEDLNEIDLIKLGKIYEGEREQEYPLYSSRRIANPSVVPEKKKVKIYKIDFLGLENLSNKELFGKLLSSVSKVKGNFRQEEILTLWKKALLDQVEKTEQTYFLAEFKARVSSGTYIRSLVEDFGKTLGLGATIFSIKRVRVGDYKIEDSLDF